MTLHPAAETETMSAAIHYSHLILLLAPDLEPVWLFQAARAYVLAFEPIISSRPEVLRGLPASARIAVLLICRSGQARRMQSGLQDAHSGLIGLETLIADDLPRLELELNWRARQGQALMRGRP